MPLSIFQIPLQKKPVQAEFHPRNNSIIILYGNGDLQSLSSEGKENWTHRFDCEPVAFRINTAGDLIALLGRSKLFFYNLLTDKSSSKNIDDKIQLMEFYKDSVLLGGYQNNIILMKQNGTVLKKIEFDSLIRQFKQVHSTDSLIIYNQDRKLLCSDMDGNILWQIENLIIHKNILVSGEGDTGYFILDPNDLLLFNVSGESFYEVFDERMIKSFSSSWDGNNLLILDSEGELIMFDKMAQKQWEYRLEHEINHIGISPKGDFFLTIDDDDVLSLYSTDSTDKNREQFFEITDDKRIFSKEAIWTIRPGGFNAAASPGELTVSHDGALFGVTGFDGSIYFCDEEGKTRYQTTFTSAVKDIGISHDSQYGYIYGGDEIVIVDFKNDKKKFILFDNKLSGRPIVNFYQQKIYTASREKELLIYDFAGHLITTAALKGDYKKGISCEPHGIVLFNEHEITGYSDSGKAFFTFPIENEINSFFYSDSLLICSSRDNIIRVDLSTLKGKRKPLKFKGINFRIVSIEPFLVVTEDKILFHLDSNLSIISRSQVQSPDSHFYMEDGRCYEILKNYNTLYCYNDKKEMIWRYSQEERIIESAFMRNGMVFSSEDSVKYFEIRKKDDSNKDFSQYLEI